jgi:hypothetical protein
MVGCLVDSGRYRPDRREIAVRKVRENTNMKIVTAMAAAALLAATTAPAVAAPVNAASLSVAKNVRVSGAKARSNELAGGGIVVALLAAAAVAGGIVIAVDDNDDSDSN